MLRNLTAISPCVASTTSVDGARSLSNASNPSAAAPTEHRSRAMLANAGLSSVRHVLYPDIWGVVGTFGSRVDLLNLRTTNKQVAKGADRSIQSLTVTADRAPLILAALGNATGLNHIGTISIEQCNNSNFPAMMAAISALPHAHVNIYLTRQANLLSSLYVNAEALLLTIAPASLHLLSDGIFIDSDARVLSELTYPIFLTTALYGSENALDLLPLVAVRALVSLTVHMNRFDDRVAQALQGHRALRELRLRDRGGLSARFQNGFAISDGAVATLAGNPVLRTLEIGPTKAVMGDRAIEALAASRTLEHLSLVSLNQPFDASVAEMLAHNQTLLSLQIALRTGYGHLARMPALRSLVINDERAEISLDDARQFARHGRLQELRIENAKFETGALAVLASSAIEKLTVYCRLFDEQTVSALLSNTHLRALSLTLLRPSEAVVRHAIALAAHPTLTSLSIRNGMWAHNRRPENFVMTDVERAAVFEAWGPHRPAVALTADI